MNRIKMLSMKVLQDHKEKFGVDFAKNKQALNDICKINSKSLKNKLAGYITKFIKNEFKAKIEKAKRIANTKEVILEEKQLNTVSDTLPVQASL
uniref:30S ribosomal protein S17e n=2 Tax=environmental samples TaxID=651140 RepID=A0A075GF59_9ARCH|nr:Ribosomal protein S17E (RP-S17e, RPS17) [uncultured marine thaumarchaeote KM3_156_B03]